MLVQELEFFANHEHFQQKECIPVRCVPPARNCTVVGSLPDRDPPWTGVKTLPCRNFVAGGKILNGRNTSEDSDSLILVVLTSHLI